MKTSISEEKFYVPFCIQTTEIVYGYKNNVGEVVVDAEPSHTLFSDKNPIYASMVSVEDWKHEVEHVANQLAENFQQFIVYVTYIPVEVKIFQKQ